MTLADYSRQELCLPAVRETDGPGVLLQLCRALQCGGAIPDSLAFYDHVVHQYLLGEDDVIGAIGLVAGWSHTVAATTLAIGRLPAPIAWRHDSHRVQLVFLVAAPAAETNGAGVLAAISRLGRDEPAATALLAAPTAATMLATLRGVTVADEVPAGPVAGVSSPHGA